MGVQAQICMTCFMMVNLFLKNKSKRKRKDQVMYKAPDISSKSNLEPPENSAEKGDGSTTFCLGKKKENLIRFLLSSSKKMMGTRSRPLSKEDPS